MSTIDIAAIAAAAAGKVVGVRGGSGLALTGGQVVTAAHNVRGGHAGLGIRLADGRRVEGRVLGASQDLDLAVVEADLGTLEPLAWGDPSSLAIGTEVVAVAAPQGVARVTAGAVAAIGSRFHTANGSPVAGVIEHTAPLAPGSSGGPVLDASGAVVALNANRLGGGLYQAIPTDAAFRATIESLARGEEPTRKRLQVAVAPSGKARHLRQAVGLEPLDGVLLTGVDEDGPGHVAGLRRGDLITAVDGTALRGPDDLLLALRSAGDSAELTVVRGAEPQRTVTVSFAASSAR